MSIFGTGIFAKISQKPNSREHERWVKEVEREKEEKTCFCQKKEQNKTCFYIMLYVCIYIIGYYGS
jgi:hypothetical protein